MTTISSAERDRFVSGGGQECLATARARLEEVAPTTDELVGHLRARVMTEPGHYRMLPTIANGQPAAVAYHRRAIGHDFRPFAIAVLTVDRRRTTAITIFAGPALVARFGFPDMPPDPATDSF